MIDLEKISPEPWKASIGNIGGPHVSDASGRFIIDVRAAFIRLQTDKAKAFDIDDAGPEASANAQFIALARNAFAGDPEALAWWEANRTKATIDPSPRGGEPTNENR